MWEFIIIVFLVLASAYWIIKPLLSSEQLQDSFSPTLEEQLNQITLKKESAYATIKELEFDLSMGKLSEEDFEAMKKQYTLDALKYMEEIDQLQASNNMEEKPSGEGLEEEQKNEKTTPDEAPSASQDGLFCTQCGEKASKEDHFCSSCGANLKESKPDRS